MQASGPRERGRSALRLCLLATLLVVAGCSGPVATPSPVPTPSPTVRTTPVPATPSPTPQPSDVFTPTGSTQVVRLNATLLHDGRVLMVGGFDSANTAQASAEIFNPWSGAYSLVGPLNSPRLDPSVTVLQDGRVLIAGGEDDAPAPQ